MGISLRKEGLPRVSWLGLLRVMRRCGALVLSCLLSVLAWGCSFLDGLSRVDANQEVPGTAPSAEFLDVGHVATVRGRGNPFVLISLNEGVKLPDKAYLDTRSADGRPGARLRLSSQRRGAYRAADILAGTPRLGDAVILRYARQADSDDFEEGSEGAATPLEPPPLLRRPDGAKPETASPVQETPLPEAVTPAPPPERAPSPGPSKPKERRDMVEPPLPDWNDF